MTETARAATAVGKAERQVQGPTTCLAFVDRAEEAINFYVSLFRNSRVVSLVRSDGTGPIPKGKLVNATFELNGREFVAFDGGPHFKFTDGTSLVLTCQTQEEIDDLWAKLSKGGAEGPCGWLTDRFGVSWQIIPTALGEMLSNPAAGNSAKAMEAMLKMGKLDIAALRRAFETRS